jgi:hypothetical protein
MNYQLLNLVTFFSPKEIENSKIIAIGIFAKMHQNSLAGILNRMIIYVCWLDIALLVEYPTRDSGSLGSNLDLFCYMFFVPFTLDLGSNPGLVLCIVSLPATFRTCCTHILLHLKTM